MSLAGVVSSSFQAKLWMRLSDSYIACLIFDSYPTCFIALLIPVEKYIYKLWISSLSHLLLKTPFFCCYCIFGDMFN